MLACPEQLRLCLTVLQNALIMIQLRHPSRHEPSDVNMLEKYKEYLLQVGDYCYALCSSEESGSLVPPWDLVLSYEHAIASMHIRSWLLLAIQLCGRANPQLQRALGEGG